MTEREFYIRASYLPFLIPLGAALILAPFWLFRLPLLYDSSVLGVFMGIGFTGLWSTIPYAVFLVLVRDRWSLAPASAAQMRRMSWVAPLLIAIPLGVATAIAGFVGGDVQGGLVVGAILAEFAIPVGYGYVALIEILRFIARRTKLIEEGHILTSAA